MTLTYRFGRFELRPATRQLFVDQQPATLGARAFDLLLALIERRDQLVTKNELLELVWPGLVVEENNLQVQVSALRKLLGPDAIATVAGRGYRFTLEPNQVDVPLPSAARVVKHNLPAQVASFIGREHELADLRAMLARHRLVTLVGIGGIGKTRLALQFAAGVVDTYPDGVWFVELAPISDPSLVANAVATELGIPDEPGRPVIESLHGFIEDRALLLVLDNCEHLVLACAQLARDLLQTGRGVTIIATSREPLHVSGEATLPLATLPAPNPAGEHLPDALNAYAAVRLFLDRAVAVRPDFALSHDNAPAVARICHDLDGIPLAIELAAARVRSMSAEAIAGHLTDRFALLKGGDRTVLPRHQTLRAAIDWSYDLLASAERVLLQRLSAFAGGFALDAAEAVGAGDDISPHDVLDLLGHLVEKSLVTFDGKAERYKLLETVRQYALECLAEAGAETRTRDRHLQFHVALAERAERELDGPKQESWRARLDAERENILLAFAHARRARRGGTVGLRMVHALLGWMVLREVELWREVTLLALAHPDAQQEDVTRCRALYVAATMSTATGRPAEGYALAQSSARIARARGDVLELAEALCRLGYAALELDRTAEALEHLGEGLALARQVDKRSLVAAFLTGLGEVHSLQGQFELAEAAYLESRAAFPGNAVNESVALGNLARNAIALRAEAVAIRYLREVVAIAGGKYEHHAAAALLWSCAGLAALRGEWVRALRWGGAATACQERYNLFDSVDARFNARSISTAREALGTEAADAALAAGRALSTETALREVEAWLDALPPA
jgi:predicted ATPase/DNA-binding winged helix-turn-helix (wHTH) protein